MFSYDGDTLKVYKPLARNLNEQEKSIMKSWQKVLADAEKENPYSDHRSLYDSFFSGSECPWLSGARVCMGKKLVGSHVLDFMCKGDLILEYKIHREGK